MTECELKGQALVDLLSCFAQQSGAATAEFVNTKIEEVINVHGIDLTEISNKISIINAELDADDVAFQGILDAIAALQTSVANNQTSIADVNTALTQGIAGLQASINTERARVNSELARIEALIPTVHAPYDDTEVRALIQANIEAIGSEAATRTAEIARLEGLIANNSSSISALQTAVAANVTAINANAASISSLEAVVAANKAATDAKIAEVEACFDAFFGVIEATTCESLTNAFKAGLNAGNQSSGL